MFVPCEQISNALVDGMITVKTDEICAAIKMCFNDTRSVLEPAGALGIAGASRAWCLDRVSCVGCLPFQPL